LTKIPICDLLRKD